MKVSFGERDPSFTVTNSQSSRPVIATITSPLKRMSETGMRVLDLWDAT
jgi:hypothetical protein